MQERLVKVGQHVVYHDPKGVPFDALVTAVWSQVASGGCINMVLVQQDDSMQDQYGRQIFRVTSHNHKDYMHVHGNYWRFADEEPNGYTPPVEV